MEEAQPGLRGEDSQYRVLDPGARSRQTPWRPGSHCRAVSYRLGLVAGSLPGLSQPRGSSLMFYLGIFS